MNTLSSGGGTFHRRSSVNLIDRIDSWAITTPDAIAHCCGTEQLSYAQLQAQSDALAARIVEWLPDNREPLVVYGHKAGAMLSCFLACAKSGHAYIPIDVSWPQQRMAAVISGSGTPLVLATAPFTPPALAPGAPTPRWVLPDELTAAFASQPTTAQPLVPVAGDEPVYVLYTSGSTGRPKGVQVTLANLAAFADWNLTLVADVERAGRVYLNQAPFSFDLSVMDLYGALVSGATLHSVTADTVAHPAQLLADLAASAVSVWVSTPSFAELCLAMPQFDAALLPNLQRFLFCGETLTPETAHKLKQRFPGAAVVNTYGPTESTVAVTSVEITPAVLAQAGPLPIGSPKPGTTIFDSRRRR